ncbi:MAG: hypothetical protein WC331_10950, partial [Candidatus Omnitrophota bacterium]
CLKIRNSSGVGGTNGGWWLYAIIIGVTYTWPEAFEFETYSEGEIRIAKKTRIFLNQGWTEIPKSAFLREWRKLNQRINGMEDRGFQK